MLGFAHSQDVPNSIKELGEKYSTVYLNITKSIYDQKKVLLSNSKYFATTTDLFNTEAKIFGLANTKGNSSVISNIDYIFMNGNSSFDKLPVNNLDGNLFSLLKDCVSGISNLNSETELSDYYTSAAKKIKSSSLSQTNIDIASMYLSGLVASSDATAKVLKEQSAIENAKFSLWGAIKCAAGTVGGAVLGGLAGAAVGTVTLPIIGTVSGTAVGFYGGALTGMAASC